MPKRVSKSLNPYVDRRDGSKQSALTSTRQPSRLITFHFTPTIAYNDSYLQPSIYMRYTLLFKNSNAINPNTAFHRKTQTLPLPNSPK